MIISHTFVALVYEIDCFGNLVLEIELNTVIGMF